MGQVVMGVNCVMAHGTKYSHGPWPTWFMGYLADLTAPRVANHNAHLYE